MRIATKVQKTETVIKDIKVPYYAKSVNPLLDGMGTYYRINENGSITSCYCYSNSCASIFTEAKGSLKAYSDTIAKILVLPTSTHTEFMEAMENARAFQEENMLSTEKD